MVGGFFFAVERAMAYLRAFRLARFLNQQGRRNGFQYPNRARRRVAVLIAKRPGASGHLTAFSADGGEAPGCNLGLPGEVVATGRRAREVLRPRAPHEWDGTGLAMPTETEDAILE